jgi:hypothetical protein
MEYVVSGIPSAGNKIVGVRSFEIFAFVIATASVW